MKGQFDDVSYLFPQEIPELLPESKTVKIGLWKILLIHGHQIVPWGDEETLAVYLKENDADIAVYGNTHEARVSKLEKKIYISPGTLTGAYGGLKQY